MPVVIFRAFGQLFVTEFVNGVDFPKLVNIVSKFVPVKRINGGLNKERLRVLCELASTEKDRRLIRVAASQGQSASAAILKHMLMRIVLAQIPGAEQEF
jgi:hypothetical protein